MKPFVSIIIAVYNTEKYLRECLDSALQQTDQDVEVIVVNDASPDHSAEILKEYEENHSNLKVITHPENLGRLLTRQSGIDAASGEYSVFLDSDDYLAKNLVKQIREITERKQYDIIAYSLDFIDHPKMKFIPILCQEVTSPLILEKAFIEKKIWYNLVTKAFKTSILKHVRCSLIGDCSAEDVLRFFKIALIAQTYIGIPDPLYHYRYGAGGWGNKDMSLHCYESFCRNVFVYNELFYLCQKYRLDSRFFAALHEERTMMFRECIKIFKDFPQKKRETAQKYMLKYWEKKDFLQFVDRSNYFDRKTPISEFIKISFTFFKFVVERWKERIALFLEKHVSGKGSHC